MSSETSWPIHEVLEEIERDLCQMILTLEEKREDAIRRTASDIYVASLSKTTTPLTPSMVEAMSITSCHDAIQLHKEIDLQLEVERESQ